MVLKLFTFILSCFLTFAQSQSLMASKAAEEDLVSKSGSTMIRHYQEAVEQYAHDKTNQGAKQKKEKRDKEESNRPVTMIIKSEPEEYNNASVSKFTKDHSETFELSSAKEKAAKRLEDTFADLLGKRSGASKQEDKDDPFKLKAKTSTFNPPSRLEIQDLLLILLAGEDKNVGMYNKVYLPQYGVSCSFKIMAEGKIADLKPLLAIEELRNFAPLMTLKKHFVITNPKKVIKRIFSEEESTAIREASQLLQNKLAALNLLDISARPSLKERRPVSTIADHDSVYSEYCLYDKDHQNQGITLGLTFYRRAA